MQTIYDDLVGETFHYAGNHVIQSAHPTEWFWCRPEDVDPAALGCVSDNFEHNLMAELADRGYPNNNGEVYLIMALGGGGWAGARENRAIMGEAGWVGFRDGNCNRVQDAFPGDNTSALCTAGQWGTHPAGTMAHEAGHAFGLPGHGPVGNGCNNVSFMDWHPCYEQDPHLDADEVSYLRPYFWGR